ncbi:MAG: CBS domain-containing protein [Actinomycetota bacterium]
MQTGQLVRRYLVTVGSQLSVRDASRKMALHGLGSLPVVDQLGRIEGIVTESDIVRAVADDRDPADTRVGLIMTRNPVTVEEDVTACQAALAMGASHSRYLPVARGAKLVGMISAGDLIREMRNDVSAYLPVERV